MNRSLLLKGSLRVQYETKARQKTLAKQVKELMEIVLV